MSDEKKLKKKPESGIHGKYYERKILTLITLRCLLNKNIRDFWLLSNPDGVEKFDDVVLLVEYKNGKKQLFMIQIKHKLAGDRPIVADKLDGDDKDLSLEMYQKAFKAINDNPTFFEAFDIYDKPKVFFILYNNCNVWQEKTNDNIKFESVSTSDCEYFEFIDSSSNGSNVLKVVNKSGKYDGSFLNQFYFYTNQLNEDKVLDAISACLGGNIVIAKNIFHNFVLEWAEPRNNTCKLHKIDIKTYLLEILMGDFQPPSYLEGDVQNMLIDTINKFDVTVICSNYSSVTIWKEILNEMRSFYQDTTIKLSPWGESVQGDIEKKLDTSQFKYCKDFLLNRKKLNVDITTKTIYIVMVALSKIPFFVKSDSSLFKTTTSLLPLLDISSLVVFNVREEEKLLELCSRKLKVFSTLNDMNQDLYSECSKKILLSFKEKSEINLQSAIQNNSQVRKAISVDVFIRLLHKNFCIGTKWSLPKYYINRHINVPVLRKDVLDEEELVFVIYNFPNNKIRFKKYKSIDINDYYQKKRLGKHQEWNIITTTYGNKGIATILVNLFEMSKGTYYILKYIPSNEDFLLSLVHTNGRSDVLRPYLTTITKHDKELFKFCDDRKVNIICNAAGMGKSMLLNFLDVHFAPHEWVIHIQMGKYDSTIKKIETTDELIDFFYERQAETIRPYLHDYFKAFYNYFKYKVVWLIDDYEEVHEPHLLQLLGRASRQGIRIWIVTRPSLKPEVEESFNTFSMELTNFSRQDQNTFFEKYLNTTNTKNNKTKDEIRNIMKAIDNTRNLFEDSFVGISQQTMMLAEIFLNHEGAWKEQQWHIDDLYEKFINLNAEKYCLSDKELYIRTVSKLSMKVFFTDSALVKVFDLEECNQDINVFKSKYPKDFLVTGFTDNDVPIFSHRTYAEFLTARWMVHTVKKQIKNHTPFDVQSILKMLYCKELTTVRLFFDNMLTKELPLHSAVVNQDAMKVIEIFSSQTSEFISTDLLGRSILHMTSSYGNRYEIQTSKEIKSLIRNIDEHAQIKKAGKNILLNIPVMETINSNISLIIEVMVASKDIPCIRSWYRNLNSRDRFLKLLPADYTILSGSLSELNTILGYDKNQQQLPLQNEVSEECKYFLLYHSIQNSFNNIFFKIDLTNIHHIKVNPAGTSLLHLAVASRNTQAVLELTKKYTIMEWGVDNNGDTPLHLACNQKDDCLLQILLNSNKVNVQFLNLKNKKGESHLYVLARRDHAGWISKLIDDYPDIDIDAQCNDGNTPFVVSIIYKNIKVAKLFLTNGAKIDHQNKKNMTALHYATLKGFVDCTRSLIKWECQVNCQDDYGITPLMRASARGYKTIVKLLLANQAKVNLCNINKWTALHYAVKSERIHVVSLLLENEANANSINENGYTPLMVACQYDVPEAVKLLIKYNANVNYISKKKTNALRVALSKKRNRCIDILLQTEEDIFG